MMSTAPIMSVSSPGLMSTNAAVNKLKRSQIDVGVNR